MLNKTEIRPYHPTDKNIISPWFRALSQFYDGHEEGNLFLEQLINREKHDPLGYFTVSKELHMVHDPATENPLGFVCLNYKRGGSVKIGPLIVSPEARGRGIGTILVEHSIDVAKKKEKRKIYATTSHLNIPVNKIFKKMGFNIEAQYPDHYKSGSNELIWGLFLNKSLEENGDCDQSRITTIIEDKKNDDIEIIPFSSLFKQGLSNLILNFLPNWHDEINEEFVNAMISGHEKGLDFEQKGKIILIAVNQEDKIKGMATITPKRGSPCKLYPLIGTFDAQTQLLKSANQIAQETGSRKLYIFTPVEDFKQQEILKVSDYKIRGILKAPYKPKRDLICFDKFVQTS